VNEALRRPFEMGAVCRRHVLYDCRIASHAIVAGVTGYATAAMQQLDGARGISDARARAATS